MRRVSRRSFVTLPGVGLAAALLPDAVRAQAPPLADPGGADWFPRQDPAVAKEVVGASHGNLARVRELVERQPALARSAVDWGFGDWETALGAAAHTGRREIAELLLANGAPPTLFSAAMLGQLDVVRALVAARPGVQGMLGPHGITLLAHARTGGADSTAVVQYLESIGGADTRTATQPLAPADRDAVVGRYRFGPGPRDHFDVSIERDQLGIVRPGGDRRNLFHTGDLVFFPVGVPSVKIAFAREGGKVIRLTVADPQVLVTATRT